MKKFNNTTFSNIIIILSLFIGIFFIINYTDLFRLDTNSNFQEGLENVSGQDKVEGSDEGKDEGKDESTLENSESTKKNMPTPVKNMHTAVESKINNIKEKTKSKDEAKTEEESNTNGVQLQESFTNMDPASSNFAPANLNPFLPYSQKNREPVNINKFFFDDTSFTSQCCPSTYSSSSGCACMTPQQLQYLASRGGNAI